MLGKGLTVFSADLAGCVPVFHSEVGATLAHSSELATLHRRQMLFGRIDQPGRIHVYSAECMAGERLRVQLLAPKLPFGRGLAPSFAVVAQSLPYSADAQKLPVGLPAGYSAVVAPAPGQLAAPVRDPLTRTEYFSGPLIDTRTLVGGRCYIVVWSPPGQIGKYALRVGSAWPWRFGYWLRLPFFWWQIRGWFGVNRIQLPAVLALTLALLVLIARGLASKSASSPAVPEGASTGSPTESTNATSTHTSMHDSMNQSLNESRHAPEAPAEETRADHSLFG